MPFAHFFFWMHHHNLILAIVLEVIILSAAIAHFMSYDKLTSSHDGAQQPFSTFHNLTAQDYAKLAINTTAWSAAASLYHPAPTVLYSTPTRIWPVICAETSKDAVENCTENKCGIYLPAEIAGQEVRLCTHLPGDGTVSSSGSYPTSDSKGTSEKGKEDEMLGQ